MKNSISFFLILTICLSALLTGGCKEQQQQTPAPPPPPEVTVANPTVRDVTNYIYFTGYTEARKEIEFRARVEGYLESFSFEPGKLVEKGDLLFNIDAKPFEADVAKAEADLKTREARLKLAEATLKRKESAYKEKAVSELAVLEAKAELSIAQAQILESQAQLTSAKLQLSYTRIYAPESGLISRNLVDNGNLVGAGDKTLLATLVNYDPIYVYFNMDERSLMLFKRHLKEQGINDITRNPVSVELGLGDDSNYPYSGVSDYLDSQVDLSTGTILTRAKFDNKDLYIIPGLFAKIRIPTHVEKDALLVPEIALSSDQRGRYLLGVTADGTVEYKPVEIGALVDGFRVIRKGIIKDDMVVVNGVQRARPGAKVTPKTAQN
ncbi:RND family efflux transporter, MFP subunit [Desulfocapsa sulfexigens DSM 10523]|uniref:RND family efflux transporter, MFP subunit n=1 Tax=Desulfocapsa sulfexigens (strain DSM 10523 / SB164P1) TaxID=1167006 RepID=M1PBS6_DESSD|nr:efflux RND transporter periplasmic adaptor subunit [Desulfocapsa sulfexigens]AGF79082.1 RND family efflux transporter, MFP subunit [Desulfocapsa sulfexigens DSM 10523]